MPAAPTHIDFAEDALSRRGGVGLPVYPEKLHGAIQTGTQGSDPFYFYGRLPWKRRPRREQVEAFADFVHRSAAADIFAPLAAGVVESRSDRKDSLEAYLYGFMLHYILDREVHPYVYFRTGFDAMGFPTETYAKDHLRFETAMAAVLRSRRFGSPAVPKKGEPPVADKATLVAIGELFAAAFPGRLEAGDFPAAWADFKTVRRLAHDPKGRRGAILDFFGITSPIRAMMRPERPLLGDKIDYANEKRSVWMRPDDGSPSAASVHDLYANALRDADRLGVFLGHVLRNGASRTDWEAALGDLDHEGRRNGKPMRYYRSVYRPGDERLPSF